MKSKVWLFKPIFYVLIVLCVVLTLLTGIFNRGNRILFYIEGGLTVAAILFVILKLRHIQKDIKRFLLEMGRTLTSAQQDALTTFPIPVLVASKKGEIVWYNALFQKAALGQDEMYGRGIEEIIPNIDLDSLAGSEGYEVHFREKMFTAYAVDSPGDTPLVVFYFNDNTRLKKVALEFENTRPSVGILMVDNCEELLEAAGESERAQLTGRIEYLLVQYVAAANGLFKKLERDKYMMVVEEQYLRGMVEKRFDILDRVREIVVGDSHQMPATLSIGVGRGVGNLRESEQMARQALEMALGRGGDQAAVRTSNGYEFFGGVSKGVEKRTKVKTRIVASALMELIEGSDNVMLMGHQFADLDCLGAAVGLLKGIRFMGKPVSIVLNRARNLATPLYERLIVNGYEDAFLDPSMAMGLVTKKTLLIVVDTHIQHILESEEVYNACKNVVVIDHHRKMVGHIDRSVIFYHEPYASSASEMVTELLQYFGDNRTIGRLEAEALLAGIMLDTRNFVLRTGVRTFEAAAYLRKLGADTVEVRKLFANSMESYQRKMKLVSAAHVYRGCAIATAESESEDIKLVAPQAADELLNISGVDASFVMYGYEGGTSFSARSMGAVNVQLIMEKLGGGGHQTMAGAQMAGIDIEEAHVRLLESIDGYHAQNAAKQKALAPPAQQSVS